MGGPEGEEGGVVTGGRDGEDLGVPGEVEELRGVLADAAARGPDHDGGVCVFGRRGGGQGCGDR